MRSLWTSCLVLLSLLSFPVLAQGSVPLFHWSLVMKGSKQGNQLESWERKIITPYSQYTVAQITRMEIPFSGPKSVQAIRDFLQKEFPLTGLREKTFENDTFRFEGYQSDLRRQVVLFVSFSSGKLKVSNGFYRPGYGTKVGLELELLHRQFHGAREKYSFIKQFSPSFHLISNAYAQSEDCSRCAGNPMCLLLCRSANVGGSAGVAAGPDIAATSPLSRSGGFGDFRLSEIEAELGRANTQLETLSATLTTANQNWDTTNTQIQDANNQIRDFNQNHQETNAQIEAANENIKELNQNVKDLTSKADEKAQKALEESQAWREMTEKESAEWNAMVKEQTDRGLAVAEKMSDPKHLFKIATYSAVGAVIGTTVANLAINGVKSAVGFLFNWATGKLHEMKQEDLLREFKGAMSVYQESSDIAKKLEASIDNVLANIELHQKFALDNSDLLANIQRFIVKTEFEIEDARRDRCVDKMVELNQRMVELNSLSKLLGMVDPQKQLCLDLNEMFRKLAEVEGILQNARPNLLKAEEALNWQKARAQNQADSIFDDIKKGKLSRSVMKTQDKQRKRLLEKNIKDTRKLLTDVENDCVKSFQLVGQSVKNSDIKKYCRQLVQKPEDKEFLSQGLPLGMSKSERLALQKEFQKRHIELGLAQAAQYESQREDLFKSFEEETQRHYEATTHIKDRLQLDPRIALEEMKAINEFTEKLMSEQAYVYSDGMRVRRAKFEEACSSMGITDLAPVPD